MLPPAIIEIAVPVMTFVLLTAVGCDLTPREFDLVRRRPGLVVAGLAVPCLALPLLALALIAVLEPPAHAASGLALIAICPVGGISNTFTYLARGATALSVTLTTLSCLLALVTIPVLEMALHLVMPGLPLIGMPPVRLVGQVLASVVLPVAVGMTLRRHRPRFALDHKDAMQRTAFGLLALLLALIVLADPGEFLTSLSGAVPLAAAFVAGAFLIGGGVGHALGAGTPERVALALEFATRNVAVATMLAIAAGRTHYATFATTYFLTELPLMMAAALAFRATGVTKL
jgi:BASS family bile acid:Na+ symporter